MRNDSYPELNPAASNGVSMHGAAFRDAVIAFKKLSAAWERLQDAYEPLAIAGYRGDLDWHFNQVHKKWNAAHPEFMEAMARLRGSTSGQCRWHFPPGGP